MLRQAFISDTEDEGFPQLLRKGFSVELEAHSATVKSLLSSNAVVAIVGAGGMGKSTLARQVYNGLLSDFQGAAASVELVEDGDTAKAMDLLLKGLGEAHIAVDKPAKSQQLSYALERRGRVLLLLDNLRTAQDLTDLLPSVPNGSKVMLTTRDAGVFTSTAASEAIRFDMQPLSTGAALELFRYHAKILTPPANLQGVEHEIVMACGGMPLALELAGSYLCGKQVPQQYQGVLAQLTSGGSSFDANGRLGKVVNLSVVTLDSIVQAMFLDAATVMYGRSAQHALCAWQTMYSMQRAAFSLKQLQQRSLVKTDDTGKLWVHDVIKAMAWGWAGNGTRMWRADQNLEPKHEVCAASLHTKEQLGALKRSSSAAIKVLLLDGMHGDTAPELDAILKAQRSSVVWLRCSHQMSRAPIVDYANLEQLTVVDLSGCSEIISLPEPFGHLRALRILDLSGCRGLSSLPESFSNLTTLTSLDLRWCSVLSSLPDSFGILTALTSLDLAGCESLASLPESFGNLTALTSLDLSFCESLERLPKSFGNLTALTSLDLSQCLELSSLPLSFGNLTALTSLDLRFCKSLMSLPESFGNLTALTSLSLASCRRLDSLPESFGNLTALTSLYLMDCRSLVSLPESFGNLTALTSLDMQGCESLASLPKSFGNLTALTELDLEACKSLASLPESFGNLTALTQLSLARCTRLSSLPVLLSNLTALTLLDLRGCDLPGEEAVPYELRHRAGLTILGQSEPMEIEVLQPSAAAAESESQRSTAAAAAAYYGSAQCDVPRGRDSLGHKHYAWALTSQICRPKSWPIAVGIYGRWGAGKSDLLNRITSDLTQNQTAADDTAAATAKLSAELIDEDDTAERERQGDDEQRITWADCVFWIQNTRLAILVWLPAVWLGHLMLLAIWRPLLHCLRRSRRSDTEDQPLMNDVATNKPMKASASAEEGHPVPILHVGFNAWRASSAQFPWVSLVCFMLDEVERCHVFGRRKIAVARMLGGVDTQLGQSMWPLAHTAVATVVVIVILAIVEKATEASIPAPLWATAAAPLIAFLSFSLKTVQFAVSRPADKILAEASYGAGDAYITYMKRVLKELEVMFELLRTGKHGMVITIDDLDRCSKDKIVCMLEAVHLLLEVPKAPIIVILAIDPRIVIAAVEDTLGATIREQVSGVEYLDKIIHLPFCMPPCANGALEMMVDHMVAAGRTLGVPVATTEPAPLPDPPGGGTGISTGTVQSGRNNGVSDDGVGGNRNAQASPRRAPPADNEVLLDVEAGGGIAEQPPPPPPPVSSTPARRINPINTPEPAPVVDSVSDIKVVRLAALPHGERFCAQESKTFKEVVRACAGMDITPRKMKRIMNVYALQREIQAYRLTTMGRKDLINTYADLLVRWTFLVELWPFLSACMMFVLDTITDHSRQDGLLGIYEGGETNRLKNFMEAERKWSKDLNPERYKRCQRHLDLDGDEVQFARLLGKQYGDRTLADIKIADVYFLQLPKLTINLNPFIAVEVRKVMSFAVCDEGTISFRAEPEQPQHPGLLDAADVSR